MFKEKGTSLDATEVLCMVADHQAL